MKTILFLLAWLLCCPMAAMAKSKYEHHEMAFDPAVFAEQRKQLVDEIRSGKTYVELAEADRGKVIQALDEMGELLANVHSIGELDEATKIEVFNRQELVNTLLTQAAEDSRLFCKRENATGSHRTTTRCRTVAQIRREREQSEAAMRQMGQNRVLLKPQGG